jgi:hypothetical protein
MIGLAMINGTRKGRQQAEREHEQGVHRVRVAHAGARDAA